MTWLNPQKFVRLVRWLVLAAGVGIAAAPVAAGASEPSATNADRPVLRFAVLAFRPRPEMVERWQPLAEYLERSIATHRVLLEPLDYPDLEEAVRARRVDLVLTQPLHYVALSVRENLYSPLATLVEVEQGKALTHFGGVIVVRAGESRIEKLADLKGKRIAASSRESLGGFQAQAFELLVAGLRSKDFEVIETGKQDAALSLLMGGGADAAFVRSGLIEQMTAEGKLDPQGLKMLTAERVPDYPLRLSTRLYPQWALAAMPWVDAGVARQVAGAVLSLPHDGEVARAARISGFSIPGDYRSVDRLMRALRLPPFDERVRLAVVWEDHRPAVILVGVLFAAFAAWVLAMYRRGLAQRRQAEKRLRQTASVFDNASEGILITEPEGHIIDVNAAFTRITGYRREEVIGHTPAMLKSGRHGPEFYAAMWQSLTTEGRWSGEIWNRRKHGDLFIEVLNISAVRDENGRLLHYIGLFYDISETKRQQQQLEQIAHYDALTQLPNRVLLGDRLRQAIAQSQRRQTLIAVAYIDLDGFKAVNDDFGHEVGDHLLVQLAGRMKAALRDGDTLARLGGDEFVAVLCDLENHQDSTPILDRLLEVAATPAEVAGRLLRVSASIGVTFSPQEADSAPDQLLRQADQAMYQAKQAGKHRYHLFDTEHDRAIRGRHESVGRIREALANREFVLHYQPKVNMRTGRVVGVEALIRWQHPTQGLLAPSAFLPVIEEDDTIKLVGDWVIETALIQMEAWQAQDIVLPVSVNVASRQLQSPEFLGKLKVALYLHAGVARQLELEVLETSALEDIAQISGIIDTCHEFGIDFALDDFGTGYSSLTYLKRLPARTLKIDQSFVRDMLEDPDDLAILDGILGLALAFRRRAVAEGVETVDHGEMLLYLSCELGQGYAIARPMPAEAVADWLRRWRLPPAWHATSMVERASIPVLTAMVEHRAWVGSLERHLRGVQAAPPPLDCQECRFGRWLNRDGKALFGEHPRMRQLVGLHETIHRRAAELLALKAEGRESVVREEFAGIEVLRDELLALMRELLAGGHAA